MNASTAVSLALLVGVATPALAQYFDKVGGKRRVLGAIGKEAADCGTFSGHPYRSARSLTPQEEEAVSACATSARNEKRPWFFAVEATERPARQVMVAGGLQS